MVKAACLEINDGLSYGTHTLGGFRYYIVDEGTGGVERFMMYQYPVNPEGRQIAMSSAYEPYTFSIVDGFAGPCPDLCDGAFPSVEGFLSP